METLYRKVAVSERMPEKIGTYMCMLGSGQLGNYDFLGDKFESSAVKYWFESVPNPTAQLKADKEELLEALDNSRKVIEWYMENTMPESDNHTDFFNIGMNQRTEIESLIQKHKP